MNSRFKSLMAALLAIMLVLGSFSLTACGGGNDEQDNCYGEDMPVVNE